MINSHKIQTKLNLVENSPYSLSHPYDGKSFGFPKVTSCVSTDIKGFSSTLPPAFSISEQHFLSLSSLYSRYHFKTSLHIIALAIKFWSYHIWMEHTPIPLAWWPFQQEADGSTQRRSPDEFFHAQCPSKWPTTKYITKYCTKMKRWKPLKTSTITHLN